MDLANMRQNGVRGLAVTCRSCSHEAAVNVDAWPDDMPVPAFQGLMQCTQCGGRDTDVRPNWLEIRERLPGGSKRP